MTVWVKIETFQYEGQNTKRLILWSGKKYKLIRVRVKIQRYQYEGHCQNTNKQVSMRVIVKIQTNRSV